jgi:superoxide dismutase, Fe-Mn family
MTAIHRRDLLSGAAAGALVLAGAQACARGGDKAAPPPPPATRPKPGTHVPLALPFKAGALIGISEKMIASHHDHNYTGAVKNLNKVENDLAALGKDAAPYLVAALREKELTYLNSMILHERYFGNLGGDGQRSGPLATHLAGGGGEAGWEAAFRAAAMGLGGGSGWVVLGLSLHGGDVRIASATNHTQAIASGVPLLVLDMYEHSYALDYGANHGAYVDAFFKNVAWEPVEDRYRRALAARAQLG